MFQNTKSMIFLEALKQPLFRDSVPHRPKLFFEKAEFFYFFKSTKKGTQKSHYFCSRAYRTKGFLLKNTPKKWQNICHFCRLFLPGNNFTFFALFTIVKNSPMIRLFSLYALLSSVASTQWGSASRMRRNLLRSLYMRLRRKMIK